MKLTIGMAVYDDFDGVFFALQSLRMYHPIKDVEYIVIDNNPESKQGKETASFVKGWAKAKYIPFTEKIGTSIRNEVFNNATGDYTLCIDSHVLIEPNGIANLLKYYEENPETKNLIQGPLWYDDLQSVSTHFAPVWRDGMYGIWATDHENYKKGEPFEIPMMGLGLFSCKTSNWLGFNTNFKGFGGEEGYIHEKFRQNGGKCICLPNLKWNHRFGRPNGVPYVNTFEDRIWNYFVGGLELYKDPEHPFFQDLINCFELKKVPKEKIVNIFTEAKKLYA